MQPLIYIIIVNYNGLSDTKECLQSLKRIKYENYKVIVIDNNSKNNEYNILYKHFSYKYKIIYSKNNLGFAGGYNLGIKNALKNNADYVVLLNNDTVVGQNYIRGLLKPFSDKKIGITTSKIYYYSEKDKIWYAGANFNKFNGESRHIGLNEEDAKKYKKIYGIERASGCSMMIKKDVFNRIGFLDEKYFLTFEESDFCWRATKDNFRILFTPKSKVWHKVSSTMVKNSPVLIYYYWRNNLFFASKFFNPLHFLVFYIYYFLKSILYIIFWIFKYKFKAKEKIKVLVKAQKDFFQNKMGKQNI
ncbi:MAG: glycosyltransferase family 2 protein [Patescibacteria group bacterium]|nr:glycosyltransferase family 2 protein [Patescibacteria group bacterium]